ncbi:MAG: CoA-binding protein [Candidatus Aenigmatarchaeota archaeon]
MPSDLSAFFSPKTVAVVGVSRSPKKIGRIVFDNLTSREAASYSFKAYAVNPETDEIDGHPCYPRVSAIKDKIDLAVIAIPAKAVPAAIADCAKANTKAAIILTAGFSEVGNAAGERAIMRAKKRMRILGPNTMGCYDAHSGIDTIFNPRHRQARPVPGKIAFISQSGALGAAVLDWCAAERIGISKFISIGNRIDVDEIELLQHLAKDKQTAAIALYLEGTKRGPELIDALKSVGKRKPIVVLKAGRTLAGARAVFSHTASLAGEPEVWRGALRQARALEARGLEELFDMVKALSEQPVPKGPQIAIVTNGGGIGVLCADEVVEQGLQLAQPAKATLAKIKQTIPQYAAIGNPLDLTADSTPEMYKAALEALLSDKTVDAALIIVLFQVPSMEPSIVDILKDAQRFKKPLVVCATGGEFTAMNRRLLEKAGIPTYPSPDRAVRALAALVQYGK